MNSGSDGGYGGGSSWSRSTEVKSRERERRDTLKLGGGEQLLGGTGRRLGDKNRLRQVTSMGGSNSPVEKLEGSTKSSERGRGSSEVPDQVRP